MINDENFRYQIYNVCDQIPQCEDGSDEGPEVDKNNEKVEKIIDNNFPKSLPFKCPSTNSVTAKPVDSQSRNRIVSSVNVISLLIYPCHDKHFN